MADPFRVELCIVGDLDLRRIREKPAERIEIGIRPQLTVRAERFQINDVRRLAGAELDEAEISAIRIELSGLGIESDIAFAREFAARLPYAFGVGD